MGKIKKIRNLVISSIVLFFLTEHGYKLIKGYKYANNIYQKHLDSDNHQELIVAHRGFSSLYLDNSIESIDAALESPCVDMIEIDVRKTQNGMIVLHHDSAIDLEDTIIYIEDLSLDDFDLENDNYIIKNYKSYYIEQLIYDDQLFLFKRFLNKEVDLSNLVFLSSVINHIHLLNH